MFERFVKKFSIDPAPPATGGGVAGTATADAWLAELRARFGGRSFRGGLYRIIAEADSAKWDERVAVGFPEHAETIQCFGYDWLGRVFALDSARQEGGNAGVLMLEP